MNTLKNNTQFETTSPMWRARVNIKTGTVGVIKNRLLAIRVGELRYDAEIDGRRVIVFSTEIKEL